jgi:hypothetical protein
MYQRRICIISTHLRDISSHKHSRAHSRAHSTSVHYKKSEQALSPPSRSWFDCYVSIARAVTLKRAPGGIMFEKSEVHPG